MNGQQINLGKRVIDLEDLGEVVDNLVAVVQGKMTLLLQTTGGVNPDGDVLAVVLALSESLDVLKVANSPRQEVGRHDGRSLKDDSMEAVPLAGLDLLLGHVAECDLVLGYFKLDIEGSFQVGLVEAGESAAGVAGLELGAEHVVELVVLCNGSGDVALGLVLGAVEAGHDVVDKTLELDLQLGLASVADLVAKV
jgi:hypothetical protein